MTFESLGLDPELLAALTAAGYENPTDVQARAVPAAIAGRDLRVCSSTGSGKTAAFMLPALMRVLAARRDPSQKPKRGEVRGPRVLVLVPTRELSMQVAKAASDYGRHVPWLSVASVVGGVPYPTQIRALNRPLDILIATPGRLIDHLENGKAILDNVELLVLDEADRMLDMGFIEDIEHIASRLPDHRQTLMASATFAGEVGRLADRLQRNDVELIEVASHTDRHDNIAQQLMWADDLNHKHQLLEHLLAEANLDQAVVFTSTQVDADRLADRLMEMGHAVTSLHGGMPQGRRSRVLHALRSRRLRILVATDVAARGIDVPTITHVINYGLPLKAEDYVHRIGRTGRAGRSGVAVTLAERHDVPMIRRIQHYTTQPIPVATVDGLEPSRPAPDLQSRRPAGGGRGPGHGKSRGGYGARSWDDGHRRGPGGPRGGHGGHPGHGGPRWGDDRGAPRADAHRPHPGGEQPRREDSRPFDRAERPQHPRGDAPRRADQAGAGAPWSSKPRFRSNGSNAGKRPR